MELTKLVQDLVVGDVFYIGSSDLPVEVLEVEKKYEDLFNGFVSLNLQSGTVSGWDHYLVDGVVRVVTHAQYEAMQ